MSSEPKRVLTLAQQIRLLYAQKLKDAIFACTRVHPEAVEFDAPFHVSAGFRSHVEMPAILKFLAAYFCAFNFCEERILDHSGAPRLSYMTPNQLVDYMMAERDRIPKPRSSPAQRGCASRGVVPRVE